MVVALHYLTVTFLPEASFARLFSFESYADGSGRMEMWGNVLNMLFRDGLTFLIGAGWGTASIYTGGRVAVHNSFLTMLCDVGLLGTLLFMLPIVMIVLRLLKRKEPAPVLLLGAQFIPSFFIDAINKRFFWNAVLILLLYYTIKPMEKVETKIEGKQA